MGSTKGAGSRQHQRSIQPILLEDRIILGLRLYSELRKNNDVGDNTTDAEGKYDGEDHEAGATDASRGLRCFSQRRGGFCLAIASICIRGVYIDIIDMSKVNPSRSFKCNVEVGYQCPTAGGSFETQGDSILFQNICISFTYDRVKKQRAFACAQL